MRVLGRLSVVFNVLLVALVAFLIAASVSAWFFERDGENAEPMLVEVPQGAGLNQVTKILEERGLIASPMFFKIAAYYTGAQQRLKFGEYEIPARASMADIQDILTEGRAIQLLATFPEGWTSWQMIERLNSISDLTGEISEIPPEGSLAPNSYAYMRGDNRQKILDRMLEDQKKLVEQAWNNRDPDVPITSPEELLILASIIEKETGNAEERPLVASVFANRLEKGMKLQTDPTVIYGITLGKEQLGRGLRRSELGKETPYNTYVIEGLPPTPIANPGAASLQAAANPADTDFVYFVAKTLNPSDGHNFARTLEEHNENVKVYRALEAQAN